MNIKPGDSVRATAAFNETIVLRVLGVGGSHIFVTTDAELSSAAKEKREPARLGWRISDVLEVINPPAEKEPE